jgi:Domain of unknown function(DUF2779)
MHLSKSDFKVARTCGTKLYYRKLRYPTTTGDDPYLEFLADGGYMIETIAKLLFPDGREIGFGAGEDAVALTASALQADNTTLFEATVKHGLLLARIDILEKRGNCFRLIEVKAKSFNSDSEGNPFRGKKGGIASPWRPYLEDVAFQALILRNVFPEAEVQPYLCLVDKAENCDVGIIFDQFQFSTPSPEEPRPRFQRPQVNFTGDVEALRTHPFVKLINVSEEVDELLPEVRAAAAEFAALLTHAGPQRMAPELGTKCKGCEYRDADAERNGFNECWGALATPEPHLLDLYRVDSLGRNGATAAQLIAEGRCALLDVSEDDLRGKIGERQKVQLEWTRRGAEYLDPKLPKILAGCAFPLHFIDFEASRIAVPYHAGMRPYEQVAFQWSCHTIPVQGGELAHAEWINIETAYPNFAFARSLKERLGTGGTVFVWSPYERSALRDIRRQLIKYHESDRELADWLDAITSDAGPLVDLCQLAKEYYFHPRMKGGLSIKNVLPAVWFENAALRQHPWFSTYLRERDGRLLDPYDTLDPLPFVDAEESLEVEPVREGIGAIRTYQEMLYGVNRSNPTFRDTYRQLLLNYCNLDTLAMVMIWMHWSRRV